MASISLLCMYTVKITKLKPWFGEAKFFFLSHLAAIKAIQGNFQCLYVMHVTRSFCERGVNISIKTKLFKIPFIKKNQKPGVDCWGARYSLPWLG